MGLLETDAENIRDVLTRWKPPPCTSEREYEVLVYEYLHERFPKEVFHRQYAHAKTRADIYVQFRDGAKVVVEVKFDLSERGEYHRLMGQTFEYMFEWKAEVVVVLCGRTDPSLVKLFQVFLDTVAEAMGRKARLVHLPQGR